MHIYCYYEHCLLLLAFLIVLFNSFRGRKKSFKKKRFKLDPNLDRLSKESEAFLASFTPFLSLQ